MIDTNDGNKCVTYDEFNCKCNYDDFKKDYMGDYIRDGWGKKVTFFEGQDYSACWLEETDDLNILFDMQNSIFYHSDQWWNGANGGSNDPPAYPAYQGWNEVAFDAGIDYRVNGPKGSNKLQALVVVLPSNYNGLCDFDKDAVQDVDDQLFKYHKDGYGKLPVVIMKSYDTGDGTYQKYAFAQNFEFASGRCIMYGDGTGEAYYWLASDEVC